MQRITRIEGTGVAVRGNEIDTDRIIPARFLKQITFDGLGEQAFRDVRFRSDGSMTVHPFNDPRRAGASVLLVNKNFGCGSSREHAPQALHRWGIKAIVGESFAEIFAGNCNTMGVPAVIVGQSEIARLMDLVDADPAVVVVVDLERQTVTVGGETVSCTMPEAYRQALVSASWDSTAELLANRDAIQRTAASLPYLSAFAG